VDWYLEDEEAGDEEDTVTQKLWAANDEEWEGALDALERVRLGASIDCFRRLSAFTKLQFFDPLPGDTAVSRGRAARRPVLLLLVTTRDILNVPFYAICKKKFVFTLMSAAEKCMPPLRKRKPACSPPFDWIFDLREVVLMHLNTGQRARLVQAPEEKPG
jgi:hypothetical protein